MLMLPLLQLLVKFRENLVDGLVEGARFEVRLDTLANLARRLSLTRRASPLASRMEGIPRRTKISSGSRAIAVFTQPITDASVPHGVEEVNEIVFGSLLKPALNDQETTRELFDAQILSRRDGLPVLVQPCEEFVSLFAG